MGRAGRRRARARKRRRPTGPTRTLARTLTVAGAALIAAGVLGLGWLLVVYPGQPGPGRGELIRLEVAPGTQLDSLARMLEEAGVVERPAVWRFYMRLRRADRSLRTGPVVLHDDMPPREVLRRVAIGYGPSTVRVAIPEGFTRFDVAERLEYWGVCSARAFVDATADASLLERYGIDAPSLEGYLFPATYELRQDASARRVAERLVRTFFKRIAVLRTDLALPLERIEEELGWGFHEVTTLASIVEKEAAVPEERPVIAGVFLNRLRSADFRPKRLQADPTVAYGCLAAPETASSCRGFDGRITRTMTRDPSNPYNTYRIEWLPPGPIASPGLDSIRAVLEPARHDYLYFVARGGGRHHFSVTHEEHVQAVARYRAR